MKNNNNSEKPFKQWVRRHLLSRNLISKNEERISFLQAIGFVLIFLGVIYISYFIFSTAVAKADGVAISFFLIMLGVAFAFPSLLEDNNNGLSTMRIAVFMMVNVICLLLLKIGWDANSLADIKLDQYWVGIIAFVFGSKATQSYFESKLAVANANNDSSKIAGGDAEMSDDLFISAALTKYKDTLLKNNNVVDVLKSYEKINGVTKAVMLIKTKIDMSIAQLSPTGFNISTSSSKQMDVPVVIVKVGSTILAHSLVNAGTAINASGLTLVGTLGCILQSTDDKIKDKYALTCFHVIKQPENKGWDYITGNENIKVNLNKNPIGIAMYGACMNSTDFAIIKLDDNTADNSAINNPVPFPRMLEDLDFKLNNAIKFKGYILNKFVSGFCKGITGGNREVTYDNGVKKIFDNLYFFSGSKENACPIAESGDSGSLILDQDDNAVAILIGSDDSYTYGIPLKPITDEHNLQIT